MKATRHINAIFEEPTQWGLRGDPYLWKELQQRFKSRGIPDSEAEFVSEVELSFSELTGALLTSADLVFVERYSHGGMSSGHISPEWWREIGIPLLRSRYAAE